MKKTLAEVIKDLKIQDHAEKEIHFTIRPELILKLINDYIDPQLPEGFIVNYFDYPTEGSKDLYIHVVARKNRPEEITLPKPKPVQESCVHTEHCCSDCLTCKYNDDHCPVMLGKKTGIKCEDCQEIDSKTYIRK
jgi:hypothetical protein